MQPNIHTDELREELISIVLAAEAAINAIDRQNEFLLFFNSRELLTIANNYKKIASNYKHILDKGEVSKLCGDAIIGTSRHDG